MANLFGDYAQEAADDYEDIRNDASENVLVWCTVVTRSRRCFTKQLFVVQVCLSLRRKDSREIGRGIRLQRVCRFVRR